VYAEMCTSSFTVVSVQVSLNWLPSTRSLAIPAATFVSGSAASAAAVLLLRALNCVRHALTGAV
jgi:hypothetical protein